MAAANALLIEDNPADRKKIEYELRLDDSLSFDLTSTNSLRAGMGQLESRLFDVVLLDLSLPDAHGLDGVLTITRAWPELAVVVLTGFDDKHMAIEALKQGAQDYLSKNWLDGAVLIRSLQYAIERKRIAVELRRSEQRYRALVAAMTSIVWSTDADGNFHKEQPVWSDYTGQTWQHCQQQGWLNSLHGEDRPRMASFWTTAAEHRLEREFLLRVWHAQSQRHRRCITRVVPIVTHGAEVLEWVGTLTDVEDAKHAEESLRRHQFRIIYQADITR